MILPFSFESIPLLAIQVGLTCLAAQIVLSGLFAYVLPDGPWKIQPGLTAHQAVCFPLMVYLTYQGFVAWCFSLDHGFDTNTMEGRIFGVSERAKDMGSYVLGMMMFWDIPCSAFVPALQGDWLMLLHHVGMLFVAAVSVGLFSKQGHPIGTYYVSFFFGMIELSSVFLTIVDVFHPKNKAWHAWVNQSTTSIKSPTEAAAVKFCQALNEVCRPLFAVSFLILRSLWFPCVIFSTCLLDFYQAAMLPTLEQRHGAQVYR